MRVLHIETDKDFSHRIQKLVEKNGFSYTKIYFYKETNDFFGKLFDETEYKLIILDQFMPALPVESLIDKINAKGIVCPSIIVISSQKNFEMEKHYSQLGVMAYFDKEQFDQYRFEKYLQTTKAEIETTEFFKTLSIAVIDDSTFCLKIIEKIFLDSKITKVDYYHDSTEFINCQKQYDLFIVDLVMPVYCGEVLINYIRNINRNAIIILMTAYGNGQVIPHCLGLGADDFIIKPIDYNLFMLRLHSCVSRYRMKKELISKNNRLTRLAEKDNLTGMYNRTYFTKVYSDIFAEAKNNGSSFSLIMADIDDFKNINDEYGHLEGDRVLKEFSSILYNNLVSANFLCRWGGEEFIALLKIDDLDIVTAIAEKMRNAVDAHDFKNTAILTASFGIAAWRSDDTQESLLRRMDNSLYLAKITGKNKIVCEEKVNIIENGIPIKIEWGPFFTSGNPSIDRDHCNLVKVSNEIIQNCVNGDNHDAIYLLLQEMIKNVSIHFQKEEKIIQQFKYKDYEEHRKNHQELMKRMTDMYSEYLQHKQSMLDVVEFMIQEVLVGHIVKKDFGFYDIFIQ
ncbi:diguanylate cyclase [Pectinatus haikarae]|uniref:Diguanylate cyclase (GGDEF)-like protein/hemerythrin-like metal-binding protein n=1 Tax=Pectinatus haikarae TaxID=349096 RepID=A0ABT9Y7B6_9FIRM|nr:diguanylate cyclase [Pectinatus haikarae]MDQ0203719.1 diguanylate cyclase (GGDEF)-like protein/hemerythrin-like metal-binding protein [Pectinatus haikarae]